MGEAYIIFQACLNWVLLSLAGEVAQFVVYSTEGTICFWLLSERELLVQIMGHGHTRMQLDSNDNDTNHKNNKNRGNAEEEKAKQEKQAQEKQAQEKKFTPDPNVSFDVDIGTSGSSMNENKKNAPDQIEVLEKINSGSNIGACGGMSFPENLEQGKGTTQESNKKSQKK